MFENLEMALRPFIEQAFAGWIPAMASGVREVSAFIAMVRAAPPSGEVLANWWQQSELKKPINSAATKIGHAVHVRWTSDDQHAQDEVDREGDLVRRCIQSHTDAVNAFRRGRLTKKLQSKFMAKIREKFPAVWRKDLNCYLYDPHGITAIVNALRTTGMKDGADPTPAQVRAAMFAVQNGWTPAQRSRR